MYLVYIDEAKPQPGVELYYWLCGLAFPEDQIREVETKLSEIAQGFFGSKELVTCTEFHASKIVHGKGPCKGREIQERIKLFFELIDVIDECPGLKRIEVRIDPTKMYDKSYEVKAFMFFVEKVEELMCKQQSLALLIADYNKDMVNTNVSELSSYKADGTYYQFATKIARLVDTIHHTYSHHSRLIQLADIYTYSMALRQKTELGYFQTTIKKYIQAKQNLFPSKYKNWPP